VTGNGAEVFHKPALLAQAAIAVSLVAVLLGAVAVFIDVFLGLGLVPRRFAAAVAVGGAVGVGLSLWIVLRPHPVLVVDQEGLDWRLPGVAAGRIGWDRVEGFGLSDAREFIGMGGIVPQEKAGERLIAIMIRNETGRIPLAVFEMDVASGLDEVNAALRRQRPGLERIL
jgi:hypothetical protein